MASLRSTAEAQKVSDDLVETWSSRPGDRDVSPTSFRIPGTSLADNILFSQTRSWIKSPTDGNVIPRPIQADNSPDSIPLRANTTPDVNSSLFPLDAYVSSETVLQGRKDYKLQKAEPFFTDATGFYYNVFNAKLRGLNAKSSEGPLCIENYLVRSEKDWLNRLWVLKMGNSTGSNPAFFNLPTATDVPSSPRYAESFESDCQAQFQLQSDYQPPTGLKKLFLRRIGDWPIYSFFIAFVGSPCIR